MHRHIIAGLIPIFFSLSGGSAHAEIQFLKGTLSDAIAKAKTDLKPVMIDFITDWCRWCDTLDTRTYSDQRVASYVNEHLVPIKIDAEKGEGVDIAKKYKVRGYPTILLVTPDGEEIDRVLGYVPPDPFLKSITDYVNGIGTIGSLRKTLAQHPDDPAAVYAVASKYAERNDYTEASEQFRHLLAIDSANGFGHREEARYIIAMAAYREDKNPAGLKEFVREFPSSDRTRGVLRTIITASLKNGDGESAREYFRQYDRRWADDIPMMNNYAWVAAENKVNLNHAAEVARRAVLLAQSPGDRAMYLDTYATVEFNRGNIDEAIQLEQEALDLKKDAPVKDRKGYEETLEKFQSARRVTQSK
jgi:thioredoxin-related protein